MSEAGDRHIREATGHITAMQTEPGVQLCYAANNANGI